MTCCDEFGNCTFAPGCRACREPNPSADLARRANERIRRLEEGRAHLQKLADKPPLHIRAWDWLGNLPHKFGKWVDGLNELAWIGAVIGVVAICAVLAVSCVGR